MNSIPVHVTSALLIAFILLLAFLLILNGHPIWAFVFACMATAVKATGESKKSRE